MPSSRRLPVGAELLVGGGVHFRVWAPVRTRVEVVVEGGPGAGAGPGGGVAAADSLRVVPLAPDGKGFFGGVVSQAGAGTLYRFRLDGGERLYPDPASRFQPEGPHGPSQVVDPTSFRWTDEGWEGIDPRGQVIYEMHIGTFTAEGTWEAAARELPALADLGVTVLEIMPVADFTGRFGWGYDGVNLFAPTRLYGSPDDFRRFVDRAHARGLGVILDVVYNHLGPDGNYLRAFSDAYFTDRYANEWGQAVSYDGEDSGPVRDFFLANAGYWIDEFHLDGLRIDATQCLYDGSSEHILGAISRRVREAGRWRRTYLLAENEPQDVVMVTPVEEGGHGLDAACSDDFHHTARVALTGRIDGYYGDYRGTAQELLSAIKHGHLFQGQRYRWQGKARGTPTLGLPPWRFVFYLQNHDQIANSGTGVRLHELASPGCYRAMTALLLLAPATPLLFQGQEFAASAPFLYFADHEPDLARMVKKGRGEFLGQFPDLATPEVQALLADPADPSTFARCKLDHGERHRHAEAVALHRDLLALRRSDPVLAGASAERRVDGAVLGPQAFVVRYLGDRRGDDRLLVINLGTALELSPLPEPLLAPPAGARWALAWTSEDPRYGGQGRVGVEHGEGWRVRGQAALLLRPAAVEGSGSPPGPPPSGPPRKERA